MDVFEKECRRHCSEAFLSIIFLLFLLFPLNVYLSIRLTIYLLRQSERHSYSSSEITSHQLRTFNATHLWNIFQTCPLIFVVSMVRFSRFSSFIPFFYVHLRTLCNPCLFSTVIADEIFFFCYCRKGNNMRNVSNMYSRDYRIYNVTFDFFFVWKNRISSSNLGKGVSINGKFLRSAKDYKIVFIYHKLRYDHIIESKRNFHAFEKINLKIFQIHLTFSNRTLDFSGRFSEIRIQNQS